METEQNRKGHGRECPSGIEECAEQQYSQSIMEQIDTGSPRERHRNIQTSNNEINQATN